MSPRQGKQFRTSPQDLTITHRHAAGIDIHAAMHMVSVPAEDVPAGFVNPDASFRPADEIVRWRGFAERVYRMLKYGQEYVRQSQEHYEQAYQFRVLQSLAKKANSLGYKLVPETMTP